jgi:beta-glucosidase
VTVRVRVRNAGHRQGAEVVELYVRFPPSAGEPPKVLKAFGKMQLAPGRSGTVMLTLHRHDFAVWSTSRHRWVIPAGRYTLMVGSSSRDIRGTASFWQRGS